MYLAEEPSEASLGLLRERIENRLENGASITTLAGEMGMLVPTVTAFRKHPKRRPQPDTWALFRAWYTRELDRQILADRAEGAARAPSLGANATVGVSTKAALSAAGPATVPDPPPPIDVGEQTVHETAKTLERLAYIQGYAQSVLDQIYEVARRQKAVIDRLNPHVLQETLRDSDRIRGELDAVATARPLPTTGKTSATKPVEDAKRRQG